MALPYLIKRIYNSSSEEVVRRGKRIHSSGNSIELLEYDELMGNIVLELRTMVITLIIRLFKSVQARKILIS